MGDKRVTAALIVALVGLMIPGLLVIWLAWKGGWKPDEIAAIAGLFTSVVGTLVGAFLGVQVAADSKDKAEDNAAKSQELAERALGQLSGEAANQVIESTRRP